MPLPAAAAAGAAAAAPAGGGRGEGGADGEDPDPATPATPARAVLARARGYPYPRPPSSFVFHGGVAHEFPDAAWPASGALAGPACVAGLGLPCPAAAAATVAALAAAGGGGAAAAATATAPGARRRPPPTPPAFTPVLAIGSNAGPAQLARKYAGAAFRDTPIPATRGVLAGFDVAYAPLVSSYGSVTATLHPSPGTAVEVFVTWLGADALDRMHATEAAYDLVELRLGEGGLALGTSVAAAVAGARPAAWHPRGAPLLCYVHSHGALALPEARGGPVALAEIPASGRAFPALTQSQAQAAVARLVGAANAHDTDAFILENVLGPPEVRRARVEALARHALPFTHPAATRLASLGSVFGRSVD